MIYKRGKRKTYWYKFMWQGQLVRQSTKQGNDKVARQMESAHRTALAKGLLGIREKKATPSLRSFCDARFAPWAKATFEEHAWKSWEWYRVGIRALLSCKIANLPLDEITGESTSEFASARLGRGLAVATVNSNLRVLRSILHRAVEWNAIPATPRVKLLPGERQRERVITREEETRYLAAAREPLASVATVLADTGMRPEECFRLCWESITWVNGRYGTLLVTHGKTAAARRVIPMTPRVRRTLEGLWDRAGKRVEGWVWPAPTMSGHIEPSSIRKQHLNAVRVSKVRPFVLYTFRHTFLTRLGEGGGMDPWSLAKVAGHSSIAISSKYVHPSGDAVLDAISRLGGHKIRHSEENTESEEDTGRLLTQ